MTTVYKKMKMGLKEVFSSFSDMSRKKEKRQTTCNVNCSKWYALTKSERFRILEQCNAMLLLLTPFAIH